MESTNSPKCMKIKHSHTFAYIFHGSKTILIINGAGGVGSVATQLAHLAGLTVIATASRPDSIKWTQDYGTDYVVNHREDLVKQVRKLGYKYVDYILELKDRSEERRVGKECRDR